jgi:pimeloyl-ACP methyl ester carboxylesterase
VTTTTSSEGPAAPSTAAGPTSEREIVIAGHRVYATAAGRGPAMLVLHHSTGPAWTGFHDRLADSFRVSAPDMPGYGRSDRIDTARSPRDLAILLHQALDLWEDAPVHGLGLGLGGWVLAEMATMAQNRFRSLVFVGSAGLRPAEGLIHDPMMSGWLDYARRGLRDEDTYRRVYGDDGPSAELTAQWDLSREMTARITWKPWMWSLQLPTLLRGVRTRSLVVWAGDDRIVPLECGVQLAELLPDCRLEVIEGAGHSVELEDPSGLAEMVTAFARGTEV